MDKVAQLVKLAKERDKSKLKDAAIYGAGSAALAKAAPSRLLGYHNVYHGTSKENAAKIKRDGKLKASMGGGGNGASQSMGNKNEFMSDTFKERSKGKVHFTKTEGIAKFFADFTGTDGGANKGGKGEVLKAKMPHSQYTKAKVDKDVAGPGGNEGIKKRIASTTTKDVKVGKGYNFATKRNMNRYLKAKGGKARFARGVASALGSAGLAGMSYRKVKES